MEWGKKKNLTGFSKTELIHLFTNKNCFQIH